MADVKLLGKDGSDYNAAQSAGYFELEKFQAVKSGTLASIKVHSIYLSGKIKVAIYADNAGSPGALLAAASEASIVSGWNTISISGSVAIVSGTYYWLAHNTDTESLLSAKSSGGTALYKSATYSSFSFPDPAGSGFTGDSYTYFVYGWGAESGGSIVPLLQQQYRRRVA